jgi:predicted permease
MKIFRRLRMFFQKRKLETDMSEEMRLHVELQTALNLKAGLNPDEARYLALRQFGNVAGVQERVREQRGWRWLDHLARDWRHAWRMLAKAPLLSAVIILSLGIGVGVNAVIFSWIRAITFRPLPGVVDAPRIRLIEPRTETGSYPGASWSEYRDLRDRLPSFRSLTAFRMVPLNLGEAGRDERVHALFVSGNYFSALGLQPALGRLLRADETTQAGGAPVAVISHDYWQNHFAGSPEILGRTLRLNDRLLTVVGVAPDNFLGTVVGLSFDLWVPATMAPALLSGSQELEARDVRGYSLLGFLASGASAAQAQTEVDTAMSQLATTFPASNASIRAEVLPFWRAPRGAPRFIFGGLAALQGFMLLVLFVVCANAASLLLARATARRREIGVRLALGARPRQILRLFLTESVLLGLLASTVGVTIALWGSNALRAVPLPGAFPFKFQTDLDATSLFGTVLLGAGCSLAFGLASALQSARTDSQLVLRTSGHAPGRNRVRSVLVAVEVALALLVLMVAAVFLKNFQETRTADPGFTQKGIVLAAYDLTGRGYDKARGLVLLDDLLRRLREVPGVEGAAIASWVPLDFHGMPVAGFNLDGRARSDGGLDRSLTYDVTPGYFQTMEIPFVAGHDFAALGDAKAGAQVIVNEEFVRRYLDGAQPLGRKVVGRSNFEIVGVVRNALYETFGEPAKPMMYFSYRDRFGQAGQIHVRTRATDSAAAPDLRRIIQEINPAIPLYDVRTMAEHVDKNLFFRRIPARMFVVLGPLILMLAAIGIYAVVAYAVAQRTTEIGVRLALGASTRNVVSLIVRESMRGVCLGAVPAWLVASVVALHMGGSGAASPLVLVGVPALLLCVALLASWLPARRAARVDPLTALRAE